MIRPNEGRPEPVRVAFCWAHISGYMAACWRNMAELPGVQLSVVAFTQSIGDNARVAPEILHGLDSLVLSPERREDYGISGPGWHSADQIPGDWRVGTATEQAPPHGPAFGSTKLLFMDNVFRGDLRQWFGRFVLRRYLHRVDAIFVPGERSATFARFLGIPMDKVRRGAYGIDFAALKPLLAARAALPGGWPKRFVFAGRYVNAKGIEILVQAYRSYRQRVADPWELVCCGAGRWRSAG
jgi:hypothetical protein